jgi:hypothetical protein
MYILRAKYNFDTDGQYLFPIDGLSTSDGASHSMCTHDRYCDVPECIRRTRNVQTCKVLHECYTLSLIHMVHDSSATM